MSDRSWRLGTVPYLNALPLVAGFEFDDDIEVVEAVPSLLAGRLREGAYHAALVSAVELFRGEPLAWFAGPAVVSDGPVRSILLFHRGDPARIDTVALDTSSLSAACMARVTLPAFLGRDRVEFTQASPDLPLDDIDADAVLRIGDPALRDGLSGRPALDLGQVWTENTGLPFVYALWLAPPGTPAEPLGARLRKTRDDGIKESGELARLFAMRHAFPPAVCVEYLRRNIRYDLGDRERQGLELFGRMAHERGLVDRAELPPPLA